MFALGRCFGLALDLPESLHTSDSVTWVSGREMLKYLSTILCAAITRTFLRCLGSSSSQPLGKMSLTAGSLSTAVIPNRVIAAHTICALTTRRKNSSH